ncbi:MAG: DHA2 family efflux MFS transporter permease subunit [Actinomycetia bacterium]|nr:DHA2 family efflux MFS transporter permease subunit [Actinomycetes bacterium]
MSLPDDRFDRTFLSLVVTLVLGAVLALINTTIVGVALPQVATDFDAGIDALSWVGTAYILAMAFAIPLSGWATIRYGMRRTWLVALTVFTIGSGLAAAAPGIGFLIGVRAVQGFGGGMLEPLMLTAIAQTAGPSRMGRAMGIVAATIGLGPLVGPLLGGAAIQLLDWRWMFAAFVPLGVLALVLSARILPRTASAPHRLDRFGLFLIGFGSLGLLFGLSQAARPSGMDVTGWVAAVVGALLLVGYVRWARHRADRAIVSLAPFRVGGFLPAATVMLMMGVAIYPLFYGLPQFFQGVFGYGALSSGALLAPQGAGAMIGMSLGGRLSDHRSTRVLVASGGLAATAGSLAYVLVGADASLWVYIAASIVTGAGIGFVGGPTVSSLYRVLAADLVPAGSTLLFVLNQLGGALGIAAMTVVIGAAGDNRTEWGSAAGTVPMLLPMLGAAIVVVIAMRLPGVPGEAPLARDDVTAAA